MTSTTDGLDGRDRTDSTTVGVDGLAPSRADLVLALIPLAFAIAFAATAAFAIPLEGALAGASLLGALAIFDGAFRNPPVRGR